MLHAIKTSEFGVSVVNRATVESEFSPTLSLEQGWSRRNGGEHPGATQGDAHRLTLWSFELS